MAVTSPLNSYQLENLSFSYLCGADLCQWGSISLIIAQYAKFNGSLQNGCNQAYRQLKGKLSNRYNIAGEIDIIAFTNAQATSTVSMGAVVSLPIASPGTSYATTPTVVFGGPGIGASATAVIANGILTGFSDIVGGTGYLTPPTVTLMGGDGPDTREQLFVQICSLFALRNIFGSLASLSADMIANFKWVDQQVLDIRDAQLALELPLPPTQGTGCDKRNVYSAVELVPSSFRTIG